MTKERQKAHRELQHALAAMTEVTGDASHGPAALCYPLLKRSATAAVALFNAAKQLDTLGIRDKAVALPALNKLAPVLLDILLDSFEPVLSRPEVREIVRGLISGDNPMHEAARVKLEPTDTGKLYAAQLLATRATTVAQRNLGALPEERISVSTAKYLEKMGLLR